SGKHPAEKPIPMLEHIIKASSYPGDIVLDCFSGSGTTAIAALKNERLAVSIELDQKWVNHSLEEFTLITNSNYTYFPDNYSSAATKTLKK
ncbi:MAG: site-specific DNA-methyltransferase, partial [Victivallales bacterium]|nr:site-specific DNA-methyltransferase [Victivallales bacterium]